MNYHWNFSWVLRNLDVLMAGLYETLRLTVVTVIGGIAIGICIAILRKSRRPYVSWCARAYIEVFRDLPVLVVLIWLFYCLPIFVPGQLRIPPFWIAVIGLGLNLAALQAEITRA